MLFFQSDFLLKAANDHQSAWAPATFNMGVLDGIPGSQLWLGPTDHHSHLWNKPVDERSLSPFFLVPLLSIKQINSPLKNRDALCC